MNKIFQVIFNKNKGRYDVVSELAARCGMGSSRAGRSVRHGLLAAAVLGMLAWPQGMAAAFMGTVLDDGTTTVRYDWAGKLFSVTLTPNSQDSIVDGNSIINGTPYSSGGLTIQYDGAAKQFTVTKTNTETLSTSTAVLAADLPSGESSQGAADATTGSEVVRVSGTGGNRINGMVAASGGTSNIVYDVTSNSAVILNPDGTLPTLSADSGNILLNPDG